MQHSLEDLLSGMIRNLVMNAKATRFPSPIYDSQQVDSKNMTMDTAIPMRDLPHAPADLEVMVGTPKWPWLRIIKMTKCPVRYLYRVHLRRSPVWYIE